MPTIEIISLDSEKFEINQADYDFAIIKEIKLISHRGLFYDFLLKFSGTIIHLGNSDFINEKKGEFFGGDLIDSVAGFIKEHDNFGLDWNTANLINPNKQF